MSDSLIVKVICIVAVPDSVSQQLANRRNKPKCQRLREKNVVTFLKLGECAPLLSLLKPQFDLCCYY